MRINGTLLGVFMLAVTLLLLSFCAELEGHKPGIDPTPVKSAKRIG